MSMSDDAKELKQRVVWSTNGEDFCDDSLQDLIDDDLVPGSIVYFGVAVPPTTRQLCDASDVIEMIGDRGGDYGGEYADGFPDVSKEAKKELDTFLLEWISKNCRPEFFQVKEIQRRALTADDFNDDR